MSKFFYKHRIMLRRLSYIFNFIFIIILAILFGLDKSLRNDLFVRPFKFIYYNIEFFANFVKALGIITIFIICLEYSKSLKWKRFDYTIRVIGKFRSDVIQNIDNYNKNFVNNLQNATKSVRKIVKAIYLRKHPDANKKDIKDHLVKVMKSRKINRFIQLSVEDEGCGPIMNTFEQLAIYDTKHVHLINDDLAYREMHTVFLDFFKKHKELFDYKTKKYTRSASDTPYFACHYLIKHWKRKGENIRWLKRRHHF